MKATDDQTIIRLFEARNETAIEETIQQYGRTCRSIIKNILKSQEDTEECFNDVMMKLWESIPPAKPEHFGAYVFSLARNTALKRYDELHAQKRGGGASCVAIEELSECLPSAEDISERVDERDMLDAMTRFLDDLPRQQRIIFMKRYYFVSSISEIADELHLSESNVKTTLSRIRSKLHKFMEKEGFL